MSRASEGEGGMKRKLNLFLRYQKLIRYDNFKDLFFLKIVNNAHACMIIYIIYIKFLEAAYGGGKEGTSPSHEKLGKRPPPFCKKLAFFDF